MMGDFLLYNLQILMKGDFTIFNLKTCINCYKSFIVVVVILISSPVYALKTNFDLQRLRNNPPILMNIAADEVLPVSYDLRDLNRVSPIRNQEMWGTCAARLTIEALKAVGQI